MTDEKDREISELREELQDARWTIAAMESHADQVEARIHNLERERRADGLVTDGGVDGGE